MRAVARAARVVLAGIPLLGLACKQDGGDGLLALRIAADATNPPADASRLVLRGTPGDITRTYQGPVRLRVGAPMEFQFPGIPASDVPIAFTVQTFADDGCQVGQSSSTITTAIKAGVETGPLDVLLVSVGTVCVDAAMQDAPIVAVDANPTTRNEAGSGAGGADGGRVDSEGGGAGMGGRSPTGGGGAGAGGLSLPGGGGLGTGGQLLSGTGGAGGQLLSGTGGTGNGGAGGAGVGGASLGTGGGTSPGTGGRGTGGRPGTGGSSAAGGTTVPPGTGGRGTGGSGTGGAIPPGTGGTPVVGSRPCDIYADGSTPCVAAHSTVRALFASYSGPLYQIRKAADGAITDISTLSPGGFANADTQDAFCSGTTCELLYIYDQTGRGNHLTWEAADSPVGGKDKAANASKESVLVDGHKVYSVWIDAAIAYWADGSAKGMPLAASPQGIYMVTSGTHYNSGCCFDYGNSTTSRTYSGNGTVDAVYFGNSTIWGSGAGSGPWVMADLEGGLYAQGSGGLNLNVPSMAYPYVTAIEKNNGTSEFALRGGNATSGNLSTYWKGALPAGYAPMHKQGAIMLGSAGDCCYSNTNASRGTFYEGAIVAGYPSDATEDAVQANIVATKYGR